MMVEQADDLVGELMQPSKLNGRRATTSPPRPLRVVLTRYRSFFNRLLSA
jgi:hypothetical protein